MFGDLGLGKFIAWCCVISALVGVILWHVGAWLVRHVRVEWIS